MLNSMGQEVLGAQRRNVTSSSQLPSNRDYEALNRAQSVQSILGIVIMILGIDSL